MQKYYCTVYHNNGGILGILEVYANSTNNAQLLFERMVNLADCCLGLRTDTLGLN